MESESFKKGVCANQSIITSLFIFGLLSIVISCFMNA